MISSTKIHFTLRIGANVELFVNDQSFRGQNFDIASFRHSFVQLMAMRQVALRFERDVYCHRAFTTMKVLQDRPMPQVLNQILSKDQLRSAMNWLSKVGPFWDDLRQHTPDDYLECQGEIVTESAVGEAAYRKLCGVESGLVSASPSNWEFSPVEVIWWFGRCIENKLIQLENFWDVHVLESYLCNIQPPIRTWDDLRRISETRFEKLIFTANSFDPLIGIPFSMSTSNRILSLLDILEQFSQAFDSDGQRTSEGQEFYQKFFTGNNALFSDSSNTEKRRFQNELTFPHPHLPEESLFCTWHGKERHLNLRLHYSWSGKSCDSVYIVYVGPKITTS